MTEYQGNITINTDGMSAPQLSATMWENRAAAYQMYDGPSNPLCTIAVLAYNRPQKTRYCVECILRYTADVDYELLLIDNGSDEEILKIFEAVSYDRKRIVRITKNIGAGYAWRTARDLFSGKYLVIVSNDVYVTKNWLSNLLKCYESDPRIGFVEPVSSNVSNLQQVDLSYTDFDDMQEKAAAYNQSDPSQWEERMRLISLISIFSRPVLDIVGISDPAFPHDFIEDDFSTRLRRSGYKLMLCRDTWICHDHDFFNYEDKDPAAFRVSLDTGREIYRNKYHSIDGWDDILNFEFALLAPLYTHDFPGGIISALVADGRCGAPALELRNLLKKVGVTDVELRAFTTKAKYFADLQTVCESVDCDRIAYIRSHYTNEAFDVIALCGPINCYPEPFEVLKDVYSLLKPGGILLFKLRNAFTQRTLNRCLGLGASEAPDADMPGIIPFEIVTAVLERLGGRDIAINMETPYMDQAAMAVAMESLRAGNPAVTQQSLNEFITNNYVFNVVRGERA
ncbi:MAG: glycosyltransferase [Clostridiales bacterium]|jgi:GT2 family glycosyltransferase|nr:glycosyltransferase [Clostridiales bacterium]